MVTFQKYVIYTLSFLFMATLIFFMPNIANTTAVFFQTIIGAFIGIDLAVALKTTYTMPEGEFKRIKKDRYIFAIITNALLLGLSIYQTKVNNIDLTTSITIFTSGIFIILVTYISALEGTKLLTFSNPGQEIGTETKGK